MGLARRIPAPGEIISTPDGTELQIVEATPRQIRTVRVRVPPPTAPPEAERADEGRGEG
jgi:putative hemolysin